MHFSPSTAERTPEKGVFFMSELQFIENKYSLSLDMERPPLIVRKGWNEKLARKLASVTRFDEKPRPQLQDEVKAWQDWYDESPKVVYSLGRRASLLALVNFEEAVLATDDHVASHRFDMQFCDGVDREKFAAFLQTIHYDMREVTAAWLEHHPDESREAVRAYDAIGYKPLPPTSDKILRMVRYTVE